MKKTSMISRRILFRFVLENPLALAHERSLWLMTTYPGNTKQGFHYVSSRFRICDASTMREPLTALLQFPKLPHTGIDNISCIIAELWPQMSSSKGPHCTEMREEPANSFVQLQKVRLYELHGLLIDQASNSSFKVLQASLSSWVCIFTNVNHIQIDNILMAGLCGDVHGGECTWGWATNNIRGLRCCSMFMPCVL